MYLEMALNAKQQEVLDVVLSNRSIAYIGCGGVGKSYLLKAIIKHLNPETTWVTAMTGIAALAIGGKTLHSALGIGLARGTPQELVENMRSDKRKEWKRMRTLVVDEISMWSAELFWKVHCVACIARSSQRPFGGLQLVLSGDFFQLPPVSRDDGEDADASASQYCFESPLWSEAIDVEVELTQVYRQTDAEFVAMLQEVRLARMSQATVQAFMAMDRPLVSALGIEPTRLFPTNDQVDVLNRNQLTQLAGVVYTFTADDYVSAEHYRPLLDKACTAPKVLELKVGAQVLLLRNLDTRHVNGSRGVVEEVVADGKVPVVRFLDGSSVELPPAAWEFETARGVLLASRSQVPLKLAWAITVHKSQGMSIDWLEVNMDRTFAHGQAYTALSRARRPEGLRVLNFRPGHVRANPKVLAAYTDAADDDPPPLYED